ncbi:MAG: hypothetical protein RI958_2143, partial [Actinomycetota bacterium]
ALAVLVAGCSVFGGDGPAVASEVRVVSPLSCEVSGCVGEGIDTATGAYTTQVEDLVYPAGVYGVELARSYRSDRATNGWFGPGWVSIYETTVTADGDLVTVDAPAGLVPRWRPEAPDGWTVTGSVTVSALGDGRWGLVWPTGERWSFDRDGRLSEMRSPYGQTVTVTRTDEGSVTVASSQGPSLTLSITSGRVVSVSTDDGREVTYGYDTGALASVAAPGLVQQYRYDDAQQLVEVTSPVGTTTMVFGAAKVVGQTTASGQRVVVDYGPDGTTVEAGTVREYRHDGDGRLTRVVEDGVDIEVRAFDASGNLVKARRIARPTGQVVSDLARVFESGRLVRETVNGTARSFIYDSQGRVTGIAVADGTTSFEYDGGSPLPTAVDAPSSGRVVFEYLDGYVTSTSDATGATTVVTQDALGNPVATTTGDQDPWRYEFDAEGNVESTTAPSGRVWRAEWAPRSTLVSETDPLGRRTTYEHDDAGRLVEVTDPAGRITAYVYDDRGRVVLERRPDGLATGYEYMADGRLAATILPGERAWRTETEQRADGGTTVTVTAPDGTMTVSTVDTAGRETSRQVLEADGTLVESHRFEFDYDRPAVTVVERGTSRFETRTTYDSGGNIASTVETLDGVEVGRTEYRHVAGRVVEAANTATTVTYGYDDAGRLSDVASGVDRWAAVYESGRLIATSHNDRTTTIGYDIDGRATSFVDPTGTTIDWVLDDIDRPIMRTVGDTAATYSWSDTDQLAQYRAPDGRTWTWTHDPADRIVEAVEPSGSITTYEYVNGVIARIRSDSDQHSNGEFSYNERGLLARAGEVSYEYDATGLPTVIGADDLTEEWSYDARGNVATVTSDGDTYALGYTPAGQLETVTGPSRSLTAEWGNDGLVAVGVGDSDPIRLRTEDGRLVGIDWDSNTQIDLDWSDDATRLSVSERGNDDTRQFEIRDGRLTEFESGDLWVSADHRDDGTLEVLRVIDDQSDSTVRFDPLGRPETLTNGTRTATLGYDDTGRVTSLQTSTGQDLSDTTITYDNDGQWDIDGDDEILEELFESDGSLLSPLPDSVVNPSPVSLNS